MAGITHLEEFQKPTLMGLVDETLKEVEVTSIDSVLTNENIYSTKFAYDIFKKNRHIAPYIGFGAETPKIDRDAVASKSGDIGKMGLGYIVTEEEMLAMHQARSNAEKSAMIEKLVKTGIDLVEGIMLQVRYSKMQAVMTGKFVHKANNVHIDFDFGIPAENKKVLTGENTWANPDHDILGDLIQWTQEYTDMNGHAPDIMYMPVDVYRLLFSNKVIVAESRGEGAVRVSEAELQSTLGMYGLPKIEVVMNTAVTVENIYTKEDQVLELIPKNRVVFASNGIGKFLFGITVENNFNPGVSLTAFDYQHPIRSGFDAVAAGFPVIEVPSAILHADVVESK